VSVTLYFLQRLWQESILVRELLAIVFHRFEGGSFYASASSCSDPLRKFTQGVDEVSAQGANVKALVEDLERNFPGIKERICDESGKIRRFVNVYVNGDDIRFLQNLETTLKEGDNISIVPAIAGGR
jgi:molybdopterin synthase sulfur carrier subunit